MALDGAAQRLVTLGHDVVVHETPDGLMVAPSQVKRRHQMPVIRARWPDCQTAASACCLQSAPRKIGSAGVPVVRITEIG